MQSFLNKLRNRRWTFLTGLLKLDWTLVSGLRAVIRSYSDWVTYNEIFVNQAYDRPIRDSLAVASATVCVVDLGANAGMFSLRCADQYLQDVPSGTLSMCCVEGSAALAAQLSWRLPTAHGRFAIQVVNGLAGAREGAGVFNYSKEDNSNFVSASGDVNYWSRGRGAERVSYVDLDRLTSHMERIDLLKCDIEGSEFLFLQTYPDLLRKTERLVIEFHLPFGDVAAAEATLRDLGFPECLVLSESGAVKTCYFRRTVPASASALRAP